MTVLIDLGNTRLKWATLKPDGTLTRQRAAAHAGWKDQDVVRVLAPALRRRPAVWIASVAALPVRERVARVVRKLTGMPAHFVEPARRCAEVINGYRDPWRLGVDRWMGLLAARSLLPRRAAVVVDIGTAVTIDWLQSDGRHTGGVILPGLALMQDSLLESTGGIRHRVGRRGPAALIVQPRWHAKSTAEAIRQGAYLAVAATIDAAYATHRRQRPRLLLTGGDAQSVSPWLRSRCIILPDLVLQGLASAVRDATLRPTR